MAQRTWLITGVSSGFGNEMTRQLLGHAKANMNVGNDKAFLIQLISQCLPFIGYPRILNARAVINKAAEEQE